MSATSILHHIEIPFDGKIHQILDSEASDKLLIHIAEKDQKDGMHLVELSTGTVLKSWQSDHDTPNLSVRYFDENLFVGISFSQIQNPDLIDVYVFDWHSSMAKYLFQDTKLLATHIDWIEIKHPMFENKTVKIDLHTGQELKRDIGQPTYPSKLQLPVAYEQTNEYFNWFEKLLGNLGFVAKYQCEHLSHNGNHFISFYTQQEKTLTNYLVLIDESGELVEKHELGTGLTGIGKDTFFITENNAIFVTHYKALNVLHL